MLGHSEQIADGSGVAQVAKPAEVLAFRRSVSMRQVRAVSFANTKAQLEERRGRRVSYRAIGNKIGAGPRWVMRRRDGAPFTDDELDRLGEFGSLYRDWLVINAMTLRAVA